MRVRRLTTCEFGSSGLARISIVTSPPSIGDPVDVRQTVGAQPDALAPVAEDRQPHADARPRRVAQRQTPSLAVAAAARSLHHRPGSSAGNVFELFASVGPRKASTVARSSTSSSETPLSSITRTASRIRSSDQARLSARFSACHSAGRLLDLRAEQ